MKTYHTGQRQIMLDFLKINADKQFTIEEIAESISEKNGLGKSTIYRLMTKFVEEGAVRRFIKGNSRQFLYQHLAGDHCDSHLHLKCIKCNKLIHLDEDTSKEMLLHVLKKSRFEIDESKTILFGECLDCKG